jgi:hypothetical protein
MNTAETERPYTDPGALLQARVLKILKPCLEYWLDEQTLYLTLNLSRPPVTRTALANEMYAAANAVYSLSGGSFPTGAQFQSTILAFGGSQSDAEYAQFATAISSLYTAYYGKLVSGDAKTASDLLNAIAGGIEDATAAYVTTPAAASL